jgi:hypothetical protein
MLNIVSVVTGRDSHFLQNESFLSPVLTTGPRPQNISTSCAVLSQVLDEVKVCPSGLFNIQLGESTDVGNIAQVFLYIG